MDTIQTSDNLLIRIDEGLWQLVGRTYPDRALMSARMDADLIEYSAAFAQARLLPPEGKLAVDDIVEVVVGWSRADAAWHLGLLLATQRAQERGGRWCELGRWLDRQADWYGEQAREAGAQLAAILKRPFRFVQAPPDVIATAQEARLEARAAEVAPVLVALQDELTESTPAPIVEQAVSLADTGETTSEADDVEVTRVIRRQAETPIALPIEQGEWTLQAIDGGVRWARTKLWSASLFFRVIFRIAVGVLFVVLSILTLRSPYAPVQPYGLPLIGIVLGIVLVLLGLWQIRSVFRATAIAVDSEAREVRRQLEMTSDVVERYSFDEIRAVVVTQIMQQKHRGRDGGPDSAVHEAWLHLLLHDVRQEVGKHRAVKPEDAYVTIGQIDATEGALVDAHYKPGKRSAEPQLLYSDEATTPAQRIALVLARTIGVDAYVDQR